MLTRVACRTSEEKGGCAAPAEMRAAGLHVINPDPSKVLVISEYRARVILGQQSSPCRRQLQSTRQDTEVAEVCVNPAPTMKSLVRSHSSSSLCDSFLLLSHPKLHTLTVIRVFARQRRLFAESIDRMHDRACSPCYLRSRPFSWEFWCCRAS